jgi:hypothetical protein
MIDVNKITSMLAKLGDPQLQQYAQMHKNDPYIMSLAMSESNRRKEVRSAGQGGQGMQEQPKVVDQEIARMGDMQNASPEQMARLSQLLEARKQAEYKEFTGGGQEQPIPQQQQQLPEDQGIGQLPAGNMDFASGGIIAFADGGDIERFNGSQSQFVQDIMGIPDRYTAYQQRIRESDALKAESDRRMAEAKRQRLAAQQKTSFANYLFGSPEREAEGKAELAQLAAPVQAPKISPTYSPADYSGMDRRIMSGSQQPSIQSITPPAVKAAPTADTTRKGPGAAPVAAAGPQATPASGPTDIDALQQKYFGGIDQEVGGLRDARAGLVAGIKDLTEKNLAATKADIEKRGDVYKGREERLAKQEKSLEGMGDKYMGLALLQAGAAMMTTPGGLGVALGKGVQVGSERYVAGLDKIEAAKSKFAEARDRLDDLRINRDDMNNKDIRAAEKDARESELKGKEMLYNGLVSDLGIKQKNVSAIFSAAAGALETDKKIASSEKIAATAEKGANARAARNPQLELLQAVNKDPKLAAAYKAMHGKGEDVMGQYNDFLKANPALAMDPKAAFTQFLMTKSAFAQLGAPTVTDKAAGPVRKQP